MHRSENQHQRHASNANFSFTIILLHLMQGIDYVNVIDGASNVFLLLFFFEEALNVTRTDGSVILERGDCRGNTIAEKLAKTCSVCHLPGHTKQTREKGLCLGIHSCKLPAKHPEINKELNKLNNLIKELEKKKLKAKNNLEIFSSARQRAASSFF